MEYYYDNDDRLIRYGATTPKSCMDVWNGKEWKEVDDDFDFTLCRGPVPESEVKASFPAAMTF
jgi:hypothetical protein